MPNNIQFSYLKSFEKSIPLQFKNIQKKRTVHMVFRERLFRPDKLRPDNEMLSEAQKFVHRTFYNVVSYIHISLVP